MLVMDLHARAAYLFLITCLLLLLDINELVSATKKGMLYPRSSESRTIFELEGVWNFRADMSANRSAGFEEKWYSKPLAMTGLVIDMPVPASFNDITQDENLRSFIGWVWYDREFYCPFYLKSDIQVVLRIESAHYNSVVWLNGQEVMTHAGGHLPFEADVTKLIYSSKKNRVTVAVNNTLSPTTLPPGEVQYDPDLPNPWTLSHQFDFFNYAGIHRGVKLYTKPVSFIDDITVTTDFTETTGHVMYNVTIVGTSTTADVKLLDQNNSVVASNKSLSGILTVPKVQLWWPYTMSSKPGYLYTLQVTYGEDIYRLPVGVRTVKVDGTKFYINNKPFYFHGVNKHEDADIRGKGLDMPLITKDINLLKWLGANSFRTSHYPYAEEILDMCDQHGIVVISESPGVGIVQANFMTNKSLAHHQEVMFELIRRDKNRPSVVMWSVANEPDSGIPEAHSYFKSVFDYTRSLDSTRPVTFVHGGSSEARDPQHDQVAPFVDVLCLNNYQAWYSNSGILSSISPKLSKYISAWNQQYKKPIIISEYGAGAVYGFHSDPPLMFTEDYQVQLFKEHFKVFDKMRPDVLTGELVWNFADFMTQQENTRVLGNRKGIFTRQRQPKAVAYVLQERYVQLGALSGVTTVKYMK